MNKRLAFCHRNHHIKFYFAATCGPWRRHFSWRKYKLVQLIFLPFLNCFLFSGNWSGSKRSKTAQRLESRCVCYFSTYVDFQVRKADLLSSILSSMSIDRDVRLTLYLVLHRQIQDWSFFKKNDLFFLEMLLPNLYTWNWERKRTSFIMSLWPFIRSPTDSSLRSKRLHLPLRILVSLDQL